MKFRLITLCTAVACGLGIVGVFLFAASQASPAMAANGWQEMARAPQPPAAIVARRMISIPFGIDSSLNLVADGQVVMVGGHGDCGDTGQSYKLRVDVTQGSTHARASGRLQSDCQPGTPFMWSTPAFAIPAFDFQPGTAQACGMVIVYSQHDGASVGQWCKQVTLY